MMTSLAMTSGDYGTGAVIFVGVFLLALHLSRRRARKQTGEYLDKQQKDLGQVSDILERMAKSKEIGDDHDSLK